MADKLESNVTKATFRRSRGRPTGSKNKPKPPMIITRDSSAALKAQAIEITSGADIGDSLINFACKKQCGVYVLSAAGGVTNVTLRQPTSSGTIVTLHGRFEILSLLGSILPPPAPAGVAGLSIYLAGVQGQVVGGSVVGALVASGPVVIMAATFMNAAFDRVPPFEEEVPVPVQPYRNSHGHVEVSEVYGIPVPHNLLTNGGSLASEAPCCKWGESKKTKS